jgi:hypothetical protein
MNFFETLRTMNVFPHGGDETSWPPPDKIKNLFNENQQPSAQARASSTVAKAAPVEVFV